VSSRPTRRFLAFLDPATLRELAYLIERRRGARRFDDPAAAADEIAEMLVQGTVPALGWYRRHLVPPEEDQP